jgi:hypothetical protein
MARPPGAATVANAKNDEAKTGSHHFIMNQPAVRIPQYKLRSSANSFITCQGWRSLRAGPDGPELTSERIGIEGYSLDQ